MVYTVTLNPALDYVMKLKNLRTDDINRTDGEEIYYGGKGINVSSYSHSSEFPTRHSAFSEALPEKSLKKCSKTTVSAATLIILKTAIRE